MVYDRDCLALTADLARPSEGRDWAALLAAIETHAEDEMSGTTIRFATDRAASAIMEGVAGCVVAKFAEPSIVVLREGLRPGEGTWHTARLLVRLAGSTVNLTPGEIGVITSAEIPKRSWPADSPENATDHLVIGLLASLGVVGREVVGWGGSMR